MNKKNQVFILSLTWKYVCLFKNNQNVLFCFCNLMFEKHGFFGRFFNGFLLYFFLFFFLSLSPFYPFLISFYFTSNTLIAFPLTRQTSTYLIHGNVKVSSSFHYVFYCSFKPREKKSVEKREEGRGGEENEKEKRKTKQ